MRKQRAIPQPGDLSPETVLTPAQVADLLQVSPRTVHRIGLPCVHLGHRTPRYILGDVLAELKRRAT